MKIECADVPLAPSVQHGQTSNVAFVNVMPVSMQQHRIGDVDSTPGGINGCFNSVPGSNTMVVSGESPGRTTRGTERAKLACVGCRRDNKKASIMIVI